MLSKSYTAAVIGLGRIGLGYDLSSGTDDVLTHTKAFMLHDGFELVAGCDPLEVNRENFTAFCGMPAYQDMSAMLTKHRPQVIAVCVPTASHLPVIRQILDEAPPELIICEKPIAPNSDAGQAIVDLCKRYGVKLAVNYMRRYDPVAAYIKELIWSGELGEVYKGVLFYSKGLLHNGSHYLDLLIDWLGPVLACQIVHPGPAQTLAGPEPDVEFMFENGCRLLALAGREECFSVMELDLIGTKGRIRYADLGNTLELWEVGEDPMFPGYRILNKRQPAVQPDLSKYQLHVARIVHYCLTTGTVLPTTGESALQVLKICLDVESRLKNS